jgi:multidrug efflux pump subunit AcrA (membrane-fusion protein)
LNSGKGALYGACVIGLAAGAGCGKTPSASARPKAAALSVRVAPVVDQEVVYRIKALGSLEAEEIVQVTAEVEGAVTDVRFHEGDRVTPSTVLLRIDAERFRLEAEQAEASYNQSIAERGRAEADLKRREELNESQLVAAEELNRSRGETSRLRAGAEAAKANRDIAV